MGQRVGTGGRENVSLRSPSARSVIDQWPQLLSSEMHGSSEATYLAGCIEPMSDCGRETAAGPS